MALGLRLRSSALSALVLSCVYLASRYRYSPTIAWPLPSITLALFVSGVALLVGSRAVPASYPHNGAASTREYALMNASGQIFRSGSRPRLAEGLPSDARTHKVAPGSRTPLLLIAICIPAQLYILQKIVSRVECATATVQPLLPFLLSLFEIATRFDKDVLTHFSRIRTGDASWTSLFAYFPGCIRLTCSTVLLAAGAIFFASTSPKSTYICPQTSSDFILVPSLQNLAVVLNAVIIFSVERLFAHYNDLKRRLLSLGVALISLATAFTVTTGVARIVSWSAKGWFEKQDLVPWQDTVSDAIGLSIFLVSIGVLGSEFDAVTISAIVVFICTLYREFSPALPGLADYFHPWISMNFWSIGLTGAGILVLFFSESGMEPGFARRNQQLMVALILILLLCSQAHLLSASGNVFEHPIDILMSEATAHHETWRKQASQSTSLKEAVLNYQKRYGCHPPPNFDKWYEYATARNSTVIDDYDQIWRDLLPFFSISPSSLRRTTGAILADENDIGGLRIAGGKTYISPRIRGTHRWMLTGTVAMIDKFSEWLPDMDLAFNIDDESRVVIPWKDMDRAKTQAVNAQPGTHVKTGSNHGFTSRFSSKEVDMWMNGTDERDDTPPDLFIDGTFKASFFDFGRTACPPNSPVWTHYDWNHGDLTTEFTSKYSSGLFLQNWTLSNNICLQPDLARLHGFHLSPSTFKSSRKLIPVFSQSKVHGYNDILFPSPWNYIDKVLYDPSKDDKPFDQKENTLFWRGATSEGMALSGTWRGMQRQRAIHLINNASSSMPILVPHGGRFRYENIPVETLRQLLPSDAGIVQVTRCRDGDCEAQEREFGLFPQADFQAHWNYRYLLDLDGAGFSGRFIPFLQSRSLPFKAALFREWYDDRLAPWVHFVPLDGRFHGLYGTLAYFAGFGGVGAHTSQGERIAEKGREFAQTMLRKEDMEIYFFRLLLEWGRLLDDKRDEIGFLLP